MISELVHKTTPAWLKEVRQDELPMDKILENSLFYGAAGLNGTPVTYLAGQVHSFVYADYGVSQRDFLANLLGRGRDDGFKGHRLVFSREVPLEELWPTNYKSPITRPPNRRMMSSERPDRWAHWSVWESNDQAHQTQEPVAPRLLKPDHPKPDDRQRFSFLYVCAEQSDVYQNLYNRTGAVPNILSIIAPGNGMGGGWENCDSVGSHYHSAVTANSTGTPSYLLYGGWGGAHFYEKPCWPDLFSPEKLARLPERYATLFHRSEES